MSGARKEARRGRGLWWWILLYLAIAIAIAALAKYVIAPAARSPASRLYSSGIGYPAMMRRLERPMELELDSAIRREVLTRVSADGRVAYENEVPVRSEVLGIVVDTAADVGDRVETGDVLVRVDTGGYGTRITELELDLRRLELESARIRFERAQKLSAGEGGTQVVSADTLQIYTDAVNRAEIALELAEEEYTNSLRSRSQNVHGGPPAEGDEEASSSEVGIIATFAGTVIERDVRLGENLVRPEKVLLVIGDRLVFRAHFDQLHAGAVQAGREAKVILRARPGETLLGEVLRVGHRVADAGGSLAGDFVFRERSVQAPVSTFPVWIALREEASEVAALLPGMDGYCVLEETSESVCIPSSALMRYSGREGTVFVVGEDDRLELVHVRYSAVTEDGWVAIESGLEEGQRVVVRGQVALEPGDRVAPDDD
jgi:HlyD family secretion protein